MKNYTEYEVIRSLERKADIRIQGKQILLIIGSAAKGDVGIASRGKIDFLCRHCGYHLQTVTKF